MLFGTNLEAQDSDTWLRFPAISPDGSIVAFSYQGDIWTVPTEGGRAYRLTIHEAYEAHPHWSPDGQHIAFSGNRYGSDDVYVIGAEGGTPQRLTYHSTNDNVSGWTADGDVLFGTGRTFVHVEREEEIHKIAAEGGTSVRLLDALGFSAVASPDGRFIAFNRGSCRITREAYRGPANRDVWLYDTQEQEYIQLTDFNGNDIFPRWAGDRTLYFISPRSGKYNIYRMELAEDGKAQGEVEPVTNYEDDGVRYFDISADGNTLVMEQGATLYVMPQGGKARSLRAQVTTDYRFDPQEYKNFSSDASDYAVSPNGDYTAMVIRGEIFIKDNDKEKKRAVNASQHPFRDQDVTWLDDSTLIFSSDRIGNQYDLFLLRSADATRPDLYKTLKYDIVRLTDTEEDETSPSVSPDGQKVAYQRGRGELLVAEISGSSLQNNLTLLDGWDSPGGVSWSPDSQWLAYSLAGLDFNSEIYIHPADNSREPVNVSMHPRSDEDPVWSPDGSKLGFVSMRNNGDDDVWFAWLKEEDWEKTQRDWEENSDEEDTTSSDEVKVEIDLENIYERLTQVTSLPGNESDVAISEDGETFYFVTNREGRQSYDADQDLYSIKWDGSDKKALTTGGQRPYGVSLSPKGDYLYLIKSGGNLARVDVKKSSLENLPFSAQMQIDHQAEQAQIFEEAWRTLNYGFYDPNFHGQDWTALKNKYRKWAVQASTKTDFRDMFNIMLGQINASHMGLYNSDRAKTQRERTGLLGVEINPLDEGVQVTRVIPQSPADRNDSRLNENDVILAVNGQPVSSTQNFYQPLANKANEEVYLTVRGDNKQEREVIIRPASSLGDELYDEWVKDRQRLTEQYSGGRLGYLHIKGMNWASFERFERELTASGLGKEGIVIDVRFNGGGWTTDYLMAVLNVDQHAYTVPRGAAENLDKEHKQFKEYYPFGERLPLASWTRPSIALCNQNSYSNAEIFSHAYKTLNLGTLVGTPTFGAVISTGGRRLIDGSLVRLPFRAWYVKATEQNMENGPAVPDIIVENAPDSKAKDEDPQLKRAVEELLQQINQQQGEASTMEE